MELKEFIKSSGIKLLFVAEKLDTSKTHLSNIVHKKKKPSRRLARDIEIFTKGEVTAQEVLSGFEEEKLA